MMKDDEVYSWDQEQWQWFRAEIEASRKLTWKVDRLAASQLSVSTPNGASLVVSSETDWSYVPDEQMQSTLLWMYSMVYLRIQLERSSEPSDVAPIFAACSDFLMSDNGEARLQTLTSRDHLMAEVILTALYLSSWSDFPERCKARELVEHVVAWAEKPGSIRVNNHGLMLTSAVIYALSAMGEEGTDRFTEMETTLQRIVEAAFDSTGLCVENSPAYHAFHLRFLGEMVRSGESPHSPIRKLRSRIAEISAMGQSALEAVALPDGSLPPLGDGNKVAKAVQRTGPVVHYSKDSGFYSERDEESYLSMKCGQSSIVHKHMDDNSLFWAPLGETVFTDAGIYNYDWSDRFTLAVKSQRGHTMPRFSKFDQVYPASYYRMDEIPKVMAELHMDRTDGVATVSGTSTILGNYTARRRVSFKGLEAIHIQDSFEGPKDGLPKVRFLVPSSFAFTVLDSRRIKLLGDRIECLIEASCDLVACVSGADDGNLADGWVATKLNQLEPAWALDFAPTSDGLVEFVATARRKWQ